MVRLNKSTRFALYGLVELARDPGLVQTAGRIAGKYSISEHHVAKVLQQLARSGLVQSIRGVKGGFRSRKNPGTITMLDVVDLFEPPTLIEGCMLLNGGEKCEEHELCRIGKAVRGIQLQARESLAAVTVASLLDSDEPRDPPA